MFVNYLHGVYFHLINDALRVHFQLVNHIAIGEIDQVISPLIVADQQPSPAIAIFTHGCDIRIADVRKVSEKIAGGDVVFDNGSTDGGHDETLGFVKQHRCGRTEGFGLFVWDKMD